MTPRCDRRWEAAPFREGRLSAKDARSFERHLHACAGCRTLVAEDAALDRLARELHEQDEPDELGLRRVRARVLRDAANGEGERIAARTWPLRAAAAVLLIGLAGGAWALTSARGGPTSGAPPPSGVASPEAARASRGYAGFVVASPGALWSQERADSVERVVLTDGAVRIHVRPQKEGERFLVVVPDGELEVRGTTFDVRVERGATSSVTVYEGVVEMRLHDDSEARLQAGQAWNAPSSPAPSVSGSPASTASTAAAAVPAEPSPARTRPTAPASSEASGTTAYSRAMELLREGDDEAAAQAFHAFVKSSPRAPQAEDASFLEAVALARAGRGDAAGLAAERHLESYPASFHRREASILVGRAAVQRGDCVRARAVLAPWSTDAEVVAALRSCR